MAGQLIHSLFQKVLFPAVGGNEDQDVDRDLQLRQMQRYVAPRDIEIHSTPLVIFDFETTGLDYETDAIIEVGALKVVGGNVVDQFETFVATNIPLTEEIIKLTGITPEMLAGQPAIEKVIPEFLAFIDKSLLVAHNAEFDYSMLKAASSRLGIDINWPCFCTLKMARELLPDLENKKLDTLAEHYGLSFEARHRSIGDVKVTTEVLKEMLAERTDLQVWEDFEPFSVNFAS